MTPAEPAATPAPPAPAVPVAGPVTTPCPKCGAKSQYDPGSRQLKCPFCGATAEIVATGEVAELDFEAALREFGGQAETRTAVAVPCRACGAQVEFTAGQTAGRCPFCATPLMVSAAAQQTLIKPKSVLPFAVDQTTANGNFRRWLDRLWFAPGRMKREARSDSAFTGIYLPHWTYDALADADYTGMRGDYYYTTETYTTQENGRSVTKTRQVRHTRWTPAAGHVQRRFDDVLVPASRSLPDKLASTLPPWDLAALVPFDERYLSGFSAESYSVGLPEGFAAAKQEMEGGLRQAVAADIGGDEQQIATLTSRYAEVTYKHLLLPVWLSSYRFGGRVFRFLINGRSGVVHGERPYSWVKISLAVLAVVAVIVLVAVIAGD
ncbi:MAG TPA: hypothetical protein PKK12_07995 [Candidatus Aminicenantes bacterium]|nr:hypothetical protein [Candidatus Aminicenantes bacterium]